MSRIPPVTSSSAFAPSFSPLSSHGPSTTPPRLRSQTPVFRAKTLRNSPLDASSIFSLQLMLSKFEYDEMLNPSFTPGHFELPVAAIRTYMVPDGLRPRMVHVSSAGVTRCDRPGIDLEQEPPAVR